MQSIYVWTIQVFTHRYWVDNCKSISSPNIIRASCVGSIAKKNFFIVVSTQFLLIYMPLISFQRHYYYFWVNLTHLFENCGLTWVCDKFVCYTQSECKRLTLRNIYIYVWILRQLFTHKIRFYGYYLGWTICRLWIETVFRWNADENRLGRREVSKTDKRPNGSVTERKDLENTFFFPPGIFSLHYPSYTQPPYLPRTHTSSRRFPISVVGKRMLF